KVMNISSILGSMADTDAFGTPSYAISKAALNMATRQLARALAPRVTVFCVHPGWVKTDMGGAGATLMPQTSVAGLLKVLDAVKQAVSPTRLFALSTRGSTLYTNAQFDDNDAVLFGPETRGLPQAVLDALPPEQRLRLPMRPGNRSLNLSNAVAVVVYEAW